MRFKIFICFSLVISAITACYANSSASLCNGEEIPQIKEGGLLCSVELGIEPDTGIDVSSLMNAVMPTDKGIFFPAGRYIINGDVVLNAKNSMVASKSGTTLFSSQQNDRTPTIGNMVYAPVINGLNISGFVFDNVRVGFYGNKKNITISNNAFINTVDEQAQLSVSHNSFNIVGNVFFRDKNTPGLGLSTYRNKKTTILGNVFGDMPEHKRISLFNYVEFGANNLINKVKAAAGKGLVNLSGDQGYFISAWYATDGLTDSTFTKNIVAGSKDDCIKFDLKTHACIMKRDHVTYIKQYNNVDVTNNYYYGWPKDAHGSVKFRNANNLFFAGNYLDEVQFDARPYAKSGTLSMDNTFIFNNFINNTAVSFYQDFTDTEDKYISAKNFVVFDNNFLSDDKSKLRISGTWRNKFGEFLESENAYVDGSLVVTRDFVNVDIDDAKSRLPFEKLALLDIKPIPMWRKIGQIKGPELAEHKLVRLDIKIDGYDNQFVVYEPTKKDDYPSYRWARRITQKFNDVVTGACAGVMSVSTNTNANKCSFLTASGSGHLNTIYTSGGEDATYSINVIDKYKKVGVINAFSKKLTANQAVRLTVEFEGGRREDIVYNPASSYWFEPYRWTMKLAELINSKVPGLCAGKLDENVTVPDGNVKCILTEPLASQHLNDIYTVNGELATTFLEVIER